jgi:FMN phosphatase YigB (HAD superfamily)
VTHRPFRYRGLVLDLDHTLFDPHSLPSSVFEEFARRLHRANEALGAVPPEELERSIAELLDTSIDVVARRHGWPEALERACRRAAGSVSFPDELTLYPDVAAVRALPHRKILVTAGLPGVQRGKVRALGLEAWIEAVRVDDVSARPRRGKRAVMEEALAEAGLAPAEVLVVGDLVEGEIAAGLALGAGTLHVARSGCPGCPADHCVPDLSGIASLA